MTNHRKDTLTPPLDIASMSMPDGVSHARASAPGAGKMPHLTPADMMLSAMQVRESQNGASALPSSLSEALIHKGPDGYTVQFPGIGDHRTKLFRGVEYGSMRAAQQAAIEWRNDQAAMLTSAVEFPSGAKIFWSDREIDDVTERAAMLEALTKHGGLPDKGYQLLHYVRIAIVQVLPWNRWRRLGQVRAIPYDIVARYPSKKRQMGEGVVRYFKAREQEEALKMSVGEAMPKKLAGVTVPETVPESGPVVPPSPPVEAIKKAVKPTPELVKAAGSALAPVISGLVRLMVEAQVAPLGRLIDEAIAANKEAVDGGLDTLQKATDEIRVVLVKLQDLPSVAAQSGPAVSSEALQAYAATLEEVKQMHELITEELARITAVAAEMEASKDNVDTRLGDLERAVFRLQSAASHGSAAPVSVGPKITPPEEPVRIVRREVVPCVAILGPLPDQFANVEREVGDAARLLYIDCKNNGASIKIPDSAEWAVVNRFTSHSHHDWVKRALGADKVTFLTTGGISSMVRAVADIVERVNRGGGK